MAEFQGHTSEITDLFNAVYQEFMRARQLHKQFNSPHEGYAVILEEFDELWAEIKKGGDLRSAEIMRKEAVQVAAMAVRFIYDLGI
jgi:hypothetical protein